MDDGITSWLITLFRIKWYANTRGKYDRSINCCAVLE